MKNPIATRIIKVNNDGIYLNHKTTISFSKTNIPIDAFAFIGDQYWEVNIERPKEQFVCKIHPEELIVEVVNYEAQNLERFNKQALKGEVHFLLFKPFKFEYLRKQVAVLQSGILRRLCSNHPKGTDFTIFDKPKPADSESFYRQALLEERANRLRNIRKQDAHAVTSNFTSLDVTARVQWESVMIINGGVSFKQKLSEFDSLVTITIPNLSLREEFDLLKPYLIKRLGRKTFHVTLDGVHNENGELSANGVSEEIAQIDDSYFKVIKVHLVKNFLSRKVEETKAGKNLVSADELFEGENQPGKSLALYSIDDIIAIIEKDSDYRNAQQIIHLATVHHSDSMPVRVSLKPHLGFLFLISTTTSQNIVWELTNSNATYLWKFEEIRDPEELYRIVETEINAIYRDGRNNYKTSKRGYVSGNAFRFDFIDHNLAEAEDKAIDTWKEELNRFIGN